MTFTNNQIRLEDLPKVEDLEFNTVSSRYFSILVFNTFLIYAMLIVSILILKFFADSDSFFHNVFWYLLFLCIGLFVIQTIVYKLGLKKRKYAIREKDVIYSYGLFYNKTTALPFNRVQHIEISNSILERKLHLSTLKVYSAGESGGDISIHGLPKDVAAKHYSFLTNIINERA